MTNNNQLPHIVWLYRARATDTARALQLHGGQDITAYLATGYPQTRYLLKLPHDENRHIQPIGYFITDRSLDGTEDFSRPEQERRWRATVYNVGKELGSRAPVDVRVALLTGQTPEAIGTKSPRELTINGVALPYTIEDLSLEEMGIVRAAYEEEQTSTIKSILNLDGY